MTAQKQEKPARLRLIACAAVAIGPLFAPAAALAGDHYFRFASPEAFPTPFAHGETRIPAARPAASNAGQANYDSDRTADPSGPQGRIRLRPMNFGGL